MSKSKAVTLVAMLALVYVAVQYTKVVNFLVPYDDSYFELPLLDYGHLANQETDPFLFLGKTVDETHPQWSKYAQVIRRYDDVRDCLIKSERNSENPNLSLIDWKRVGTGRGAEVCVFRISSSLGSIDWTMQWLSNQRFNHRGTARVFSESFTPHFDTQPVSNLSAQWSIDQYREYKPSWLHSLFNFDIIYGYTLAVGFDQNNRITGVNVGTPTKLN